MDKRQSRELGYGNMENYVDETPVEKMAKEEFFAMAKQVRDMFSTEDGKAILCFLRKRYCDSFFDQNHPSERALYQQGQVSVINDIQAIIDNVNKGLL